MQCQYIAPKEPMFPPEGLPRQEMDNLFWEYDSESRIVKGYDSDGVEQHSFGANRLAGGVWLSDKLNATRQPEPEGVVKVYWERQRESAEPSND